MLWHFASTARGSRGVAKRAEEWPAMAVADSPFLLAHR